LELASVFLQVWRSSHMNVRGDFVCKNVHWIK
jgi:hypothetical protein